MVLLRRSFWKNIWIALLRSPHDARARALIFKLFLALIFVVGYGCYLAWMFTRDRYTIVMLLPGFAGGFLMRGLARRNESYQADISITRHLSAELPKLPSAPLRGYVTDRARIVAALLDRAGTEIYLKDHEVPDGSEIIARQRQNQLLIKSGTWQKLRRDEADLLSAPDRAWSQEQCNTSLTWCEQIRLLRWTLRIDDEIMPLAHFPPLDFTLAKLPGEIAETDTPMLLASELRAEREIAKGYLARLVAESASRKLIHSTPQLDKWSAELRSAVSGPSTDFWIGTRTVHDLDDREVSFLLATANARHDYAAYLVALLGSETPLAYTDWKIAGDHTS
jgi:hypothetical protein